MGNRKLPFGYKMELGEIVVLPTEAGVVHFVFQQYVHGASYQELADTLCSQGVPYDTNKQWNKNMIARIIGDMRYIGHSSCPQIIPPELFGCADKKRTGKARLSRQTEAQKMLRNLCQSDITKRLEQYVMTQLNLLINDPQKIHNLPQIPTKDDGVQNQQKMLESMLAEQPIDENAARHLIMALAAEQYNQLGGAEYETERINRLLSKAEHMSELDADLLRAVVSEVKTDSNGVINIRLKNGQILGGEGR